MRHVQLDHVGASRVGHRCGAGEIVAHPVHIGAGYLARHMHAGDIVTFVEHGTSGGQFGDLFPMIRHADRTTGFFKIRGVNINHTEFEDFVFSIPAVNDFQVVLVTDDNDLETLNVRTEVRRGEDSAAIAAAMADRIKAVFEMSARIDVLEIGTLARLFESSIKAPRFVDERK